MKNEIISNYLDCLFPNPKCELSYKNDYDLLIAIILSAQSIDKRVNMCTDVLYKKYNNLDKLYKADIKDIKEIIKPIGSFNKKSFYIKEVVKRLVEEYNYKVPTDRKVLETFPGVGRKTVNVFLGEFYNYPAIAVDTHVERISKRLRIAKKDDNVLKVEKKLEKFYKKDEWAKRHLQMVLFGRYYCKAVKPLCKDCKLKDICIEKNKTNY